MIEATTGEVIDVLKSSGILLDTGRLSTKYKRILDSTPELVVLLVRATAYLKYDAPHNVRIRCVLAFMDKQPTCSTCGGIVEMAVSGPRRYTWPTYCSSKCFAGLSTTVTKRERTCLDRYDSSSYLSSDEGRERTSEAVRQKYGVDNVFKSDEVKEKISDKIIQKYGSVENMRIASQQAKEQTYVQEYGSKELFYHHIKTKRIATNNKRYGVDNVFTLPSVRNKIEETMVERYGAKTMLQTHSGMQQFRDTMMERHGVHSPLQSASGRMSYLATVNERYGVDHPMENEAIAKAAGQASKTQLMLKYGVDHPMLIGMLPDTISKLNNREWLSDQHTMGEKTLTKISEELGVAHSTVGRHFKELGLDVITRSTSQFERDIRDFIAFNTTHDVVCNTRSVIGPKELDIYIPELKIAFECDGVYWHGESRGKDRLYHLDKTIACENKGIRLIHIRDIEWYTQQDLVKSRIRNFLGKNDRVFARKCDIVEMDNVSAAAFFEANHIQSHAAASVRYGLQHDGELVAVLSMGKSRFDKKSEWELIRYANKMGHSVVGGASKLFKHFVKSHSPTSIVTYSDRRWNTGNMYIQLGFEFTHSASPNYQYFVPSHDVRRLHNRVQFQKHKLGHALSTFDPKLTEWENMQLNGYDRIWDCGNNVYRWSADAQVVTVLN